MNADQAGLVIGARHRRYVGWICRIAVRNGLDAQPVHDGGGNLTDRITVRAPDGAGAGVTVTVIVPYPPDDWPAPGAAGVTGRDERRSPRQLADMVVIAVTQQRSTRVPDYWQGVEDGCRWANGELPDAIQARLMTEGGRPR